MYVVTDFLKTIIIIIIIIIIYHYLLIQKKIPTVAIQKLGEIVLSVESKILFICNNVVKN